MTLFALAAGYFGCYVPYSAITKALSTTESGLSLLPIATLASLIGMVATLSLLSWWRYATPAGARWPRPSRWTALSGVATATILVTTTLAYTFDGVSIAFVMLVMRGGVLLLAPVIDLISRRRIRWFSWIAIALSLASLAISVAGREGRVPLACVIDLALYLAGYAIRLRLMARLGKSEDRATRIRFFVEEQMVATPVAVVAIAIAALIGPADLRAPLRDGFALFGDPTALWVALAGLLSQGTGVFGGLILLDASEASYCVPLNRAASILGGVGATIALALLFGAPGPSASELVGTTLLCIAVVGLWLGPAYDARRTRVTARS